MDVADRVRLVRPGGSYVGRQGLTYRAGTSTETVGAQRVCMVVLPMADGGRAKAHLHEGIETISYLIEGECHVHYGKRLERHVHARPGDQVYLPADVPHAPWNRSGAPCTWVVVHASGSDQDGIVLLPELDALLAAQAVPHRDG